MVTEDYLGGSGKNAENRKYLDRFAALLRSALEQSSLQQIWAVLARDSQVTRSRGRQIRDGKAA